MDTKTRYSKITIRQPTGLKRRVEQAAARRGLTVTGFINTALEAAAEATLEQARRRELSEQDQRLLLSLLSRPGKPNRALLKSAQRYRKRYAR